MTRSLILFAVVALAACGPTAAGKPPPTDRFYFPTGLVFARPPGATEGVLYVASANFDKRYDFGTVIAVDLSQAGLPAFPDAGAAPASSVTSIPALPISDGGVALVQSFTGEMGSFPLGDGGVRLFVPSRAEGQLLQVIDAAGPSLKCFTGSQGGGNDCTATAPSLSANESTSTGLPRASSPYGVGISTDGDVFVTALDAIDSPTGSGLDYQASIVEMSALAPAVIEGSPPKVPDSSFITLPTPTNSVAVGSRHAFLSGRFSSHFTSDLYRLVTLVDRTTHQVVQPTLEADFRVQDARGIALSSDEQRLYVVARFPDTLVVVDVAGADTASPTLTVVHEVPLPEAPNEVVILQRPGQGDLVAVTSATAGKVAIYDADVGDLVRQIESVGNQPFGIAVEPFAVGARLFVSNFGDGQVAVIDVPYAQPQAAAVVARLGQAQTCIVTPTDASCVAGVTP